MTEKNEATPFDYLKSDINGISLADAYRQGKRYAARVVVEEIFGEIEQAFPWIKQGVNTEPWQALKSKHLKEPK